MNITFEKSALEVVQHQARQPASAGKNRQEELKRQIAELKGTEHDLLGVESAAVEEIKKKIDAFERELTYLKAQEAGYSIVDPESLAMCGKDGLPLFALFSVQSSTARFTAETVEPDMPPLYRECFLRGHAERNVVKKKAEDKQAIRVIMSAFLLAILFGVAWFIFKSTTDASVITGIALVICFWMSIICFTFAGFGVLLGFSPLKSLMYEVHYTGLIPPQAKAKIRDARRIFGVGHVYLLAEVEGWKAVKKDPLIVGSDNVNLWLVGAFDTTSLEEYLQDEFVQKPT